MWYGGLLYLFVRISPVAFTVRFHQLEFNPVSDRGL